ncbi:hypothetical protein [Pseudogemmobacter sonorensis]|uniref:hypothetical protein n=1 Tax=Pseudogemmobacter sonorensis TaxID=2989681 RepID=UPI0036BC6E7A
MNTVTLFTPNTIRAARFTWLRSMSPDIPPLRCHLCEPSGEYLSAGRLRLLNVPAGLKPIGECCGFSVGVGGLDQTKLGAWREPRSLPGLVPEPVQPDPAQGLLIFGKDQIADPGQGGQQVQHRLAKPDRARPGLGIVQTKTSPVSCSASGSIATK